MNRQEPVIDSSYLQSRTLTERVDLPWEEVMRLAEMEKLSKEMELKAAEPQFSEVPVPISPQPFEPQPLVLTDDERKAIAALLAPAVEKALRENMRSAVEMAAANAVTRIKADLERSIASAIQQAVSAEVRRMDLSEIVRR